MITLSREQNDALAAIGRWLKSSQKHFVLQGPAGSGKSEIVRRVGGDRNTLFCCPTGKAANVLRTRGIQASTVHRGLYKPQEKSRTRLNELLQALQTVSQRIATTVIESDRERLMKARRELERQVTEERRRTRSPSWTVPDDAPVKSAELVVVDEFSMLDGRVTEDLLKNARKVLFMGDPFQLPPVFGACPLANTADFTLTEVHRQALDSPLIWALNEIRVNRRVPTVSRANEHGAWECLERRATSWDEHHSVADQTIVGRNKTRQEFNRRHRARRGFSGLLNQGDRVIFLRNDYDQDIFNGTTGVVTDVIDADGDAAYFAADLDDGRALAVDVWTGGFEGIDIAEAERDALIADYAYAITCHKSQGSEYDHVLVWEESWGPFEDRMRWAYTAASRARKRCTFVL